MKISWKLLWLLCAPTEASRRVSDVPKAERESDALRRPVTVTLLINDTFVDDRSLLTTKMGIPVSLDVLSLHVDDDSHGWRSCNGSVATNGCNITIELSLFAAHGLLTDSAELKLQADNFHETDFPLPLDNFIGNVVQANMHLQRQLYSPDPKFHGFDQIVINVKHNFEGGEMAEETVLLPVHVMPDCERPRLFWASTGSSTSDFRSSSRSSFALPELLLSREGLNNGYCEDDVIFRVSLTTSRGLLTAKAISAVSFNDRLGLAFEGRLWDLNLALASVEYQFEIRYDVPTPITSIVEVQVYNQDDLATAVSSASLRLKFVGDTRPPEILVNETLTVSEDTDVVIGELINLEAFVDLEDDCSVSISSENGATYAAAGKIYMKVSSDQKLSVKVLRSVISNLHYVPNHNFNGIDEISFKVQERGSILYVFVQPENDPPMLVFINSGETKDWYTYPRMFLPTFQLVDPDDNDIFQVDIRAENGSFVVDQVSSSSWDGITMELSATASSLRLTSRIKRLNSVFLQRLIEVMALPCTTDEAIKKTCSVLITLCVDDGAERVCKELHIPEQDHVTVSNLTSSLDSGADGSVKISQSFDEMPLLSNQSFAMNVTKERTAERISAVRVITNETWLTQHGSYTNLTSLLGVSINADPSRSHINEVGDDVLDLNISCLHCSWRYHDFVPKISYEFAQTRSSMLRFLGGQDSLTKVFATLEIAITSNSSSGSESIRFQLSPTLPRLASDVKSVWKDSTAISVPFTVLSSSHARQEQRTRIFDGAVSANIQLSAISQQTEATLGPRNNSMVIVAEQAKAQLIGDLLMVTGSQEDPTWFRINARVANGRLSIPLHVCCVNIRETKHKGELDVVGSAQALQNAIAASQFQSNDLFSGKDMLEVTISHFDSDTNRSSVSFNIPVDVVAVHRISSARHQNSDSLLFEKQVYDPTESAIDAALLFDDTGDENVADHIERILPLPHQKVINTFRGTEPKAVVPLIHIEETIEGPFSTQYWQTITLALEVGKSWRIQGISVSDGSGQPLLHDDDLILELSVDIGALLLSVWDGLDMIAGQDGIYTTAISVVGKMDRLNAALKTFDYQCTDICNQQATITLHVRNPHAPLPGSFHKRIIHIDPVPQETSKNTSEDAAFRFPDLAHIEKWDFESSDPMANPPVKALRITVPQVYEGIFHAIMDYVFLPRLVCLPLMCDEDTPLTLDGFSVTHFNAIPKRPPTTNLLELTVSVSHGIITLGSTLRANCIIKFTGLQSSKHVSFKATVGCINRILNTMTYIGEPNFSGSDQLKIRVEHTWGLDVAFDEVLVPIVVAAINDAPYIDVASVFYEADEDIPLMIDDLRLRDPDTKDKSIRVTMETSYGYLAVLRHNGVKMTTDTIDGASSEGTKLTLEGILWNVNAVIASVVYTSAKDWNSLQFHSDDTGTSMNGFDTITIRSSDFSSFNGSGESVLYVYVEPAPDPVVISIPTNDEISIYANNVPGQLHGDEDTWIRVNGLAFSSVDDTSRMILVVSLSVGHGVLTSSDFRGLMFLEGTVNKDSLLKFKGDFANVNGFVGRLRYLPHKDFYGSDSLVVNAQAVDEYTQQHTPSSSIDVSITVDPVNDAPVWNIGSTTVREVQQGQATSIGGIYFQDVDVYSLNCAVESCVVDLIVEASNGFVTIPDFISPSFSNDLSTKNVAYVAISGTPDELNIMLAELTFNIAEPEYYRADSPSRSDIKLQLTIDDRGTFGRGGPHVSATTIVFSPITWSSYDFSVAVPDNVLTLDEDTVFTFNGDLQLVDPDASHSFQNLLELTITCPHGTFALSSKSTGIQVLQNHSDDSIIIRGYFTQLNMALNGSFYIPSTNWYGSEHLLLSLVEFNRLERTRKGAVASIFLFVAPVCDEPQWRNQLIMAEPFKVKEDGYLLVDSILLTNPDLDDEQREVEISISVNHGGIMLGLTRGLLIQHAEYSTSEDRLVAPHAAAQNSYFESRLFFKDLLFSGRVADLNAALGGMIFKPWLDYNSGGWPVDEISIAATSFCDTSEPRKNTITIRIAVTAVNDPPILISQNFQPVPVAYSSGDLRAAALHSSVEAVEDLPQPLEPVKLYDPDFDPDSNGLRLLVNISCIHCTVASKRLSASSDAQASDDLIIATRNWRNEEGVQLVVHGNLQSLNDGLMNLLVFEGAVNFNGNAFVLIEVSDLGNYGEGGEQRALFVSCVKVRPANDVPQIHLPRYHSQKNLLQLDEKASVLIQGAPSLSAALPALVATRYNLTWNVMCANLQANDASTRLHSLFHSSGPEGSAPSFLVSHKGVLIFSAWNSDLGQELWHSDGTAAGTVPLKDIFPGGRDSNPTSLTPFSADNRVYFAAKGPHLSWLLNNDYQDACQSFRPSSLNSNIYFTVAAQNVWDPDETYDCPVGFRWMSTSEAQDVFLGKIALEGHCEEPFTYFDQCGWRGYEWGGQIRKYFRFSDSKTTGAFKHAGYRDSYRIDIGFQVDFFAGIVCYRESPAYQVTWGTQLWATDGTATGTQRIARISTAPEGSNPSYFAEMNQRLYFQASSTDYGSELWSTDGTRGGTYLVADVEFGSRSSEPRFLIAFKSLIFFSANTHDYGRELWFSDGNRRFDFSGDQHAAVGTGLVFDICLGPKSSSPQHLTVLSAMGSSLLLFQADDCVHGPELWSTDGTRSGTKLILDIHEGPEGSFPAYLTSFAGKLYFQADDGIHGAELWTTDGSASGTVMLVDIATGVLGSKPSFLTVLDGINDPLEVLIFTAQAERDHLTEFWRSDGTVAGTTKLLPQSHEVVEVNTDSLNRQLLGHQLVTISSRPASFFFLGRESGHTSGSPRKIVGSSSVNFAQTRSITLQDTEALEHDRELTVSLNCSKGWLSFGQQCDGVSLYFDDATDKEKPAAFTLKGSLSALNCAVEKVTYHSRAQENGIDEIYVTLSQDVASSKENGSSVLIGNVERDSSYMVSKRLLVEIRAINDPPTISMSPIFYAPLKQWVVLNGITIDDPDADEGKLYVTISVRNGRLRVTSIYPFSAYGPAILHQVVDQDVWQKLEFATTVEQSRFIFKALEYRCDDHYGCSNAQRDYITVQVDDNGFTGAHGPQVSTKTVEILVLDQPHA